LSYISYAQNFEDVMLWRSLKHIKNGFYIDIGAWDPVIDSVSNLFYENGWRGINVEPDKFYYNKLKFCRPDEINLNLAVSDKKENIKFYKFENTGLSTCKLDIANMHVLTGFTKPIEENIPTISMDSLLEKCVNKDIHFLKIDIEGFEQNALESWQRSEIRPWIILIESTIPNSQNESYKQWESIVLNKNYEFVYFDGLNNFYLHSNHLDLKKFFISPPNVFDNFNLYKNEQQVLKAFEAEQKTKLVMFKLQLIEREIVKIYKSRSWKITAPLRYLYKQTKILQEQGFKIRLKAFIKKILLLK
jgi:FkbM family methyltransferase